MLNRLMKSLVISAFFLSKLIQKLRSAILQLCVKPAKEQNENKLAETKRHFDGRKLLEPDLF